MQRYFAHWSSQDNPESVSAFLCVILLKYTGCKGRATGSFRACLVAQLSESGPAKTKAAALRKLDLNFRSRGREIGCLVGIVDCVTWILNHVVPCLLPAAAHAAVIAKAFFWCLFLAFISSLRCSLPIERGIWHVGGVENSQNVEKMFQ